MLHCIDSIWKAPLRYPKKPAPHCCFVICDFGFTSWNTLCWCSFSFWMAARMKSDSSKMHSINIINGNILNSLRLFIFNLAFFICNGKNLEKIKNLKILINQQRGKQHSIRDIAFQVVAILVLLYSMREKKKPATRLACFSCKQKQDHGTEKREASQVTSNRSK